jgi:hypothetical protein
MLLTAWCIAVVVGALAAAGIPLAWLLNGRRPLDEPAWVEVPFLGMAALVLVLQNLVYLDVPVRRATPWVWLALALLWAWALCGRRLGAGGARRLGPLALAAAGVYAMQGLGLLRVGARAYAGRAWTDQFNYTTLAELLTDEPFSTTLEQVGRRPFLVNAVILRGHRIGQSVFHGFCAASSGGSARTLFEPTILLSPALVVLAVFALCRRFGLARGQALLAGAAAGLLPAVTTLHLDCYLSHALALPLLLYGLVAVHDLGAAPGLGRLARAGLLVAAATSIYTELWALFLGVAAVLLGAGLVLRCLSGRWLAASALTVASAPFLLNPAFGRGILAIARQVDVPVLQTTYPWAFQVQGLGVLWAGDGLALAARGGFMVRVLAVLLTGLGGYGLLRAFLCRLAPAGIDQRRSLALAAGVLALAVVPALVAARDDQHPYQYYKLLLTVSPLLVTGLALLGQAPGSEDGQTPRTWPAPGVVVLACVLCLGAAGTFGMVLQTTSPRRAPRIMHSPSLLDPAVRQLQDRLEAVRGQDLLLACAANGFHNCWASYFARHNRVCLGHPELNDGLLVDRLPEVLPLLDVQELPPHALALTGKAAGVAVVAPGDGELVWSNRSYQLWRLGTGPWAVPLPVRGPLPAWGGGVVNQDGPMPSFALGRGETRLPILASGPGTVTVRGTFRRGGSLPEGSDCRPLVRAPQGYRRELTVTGEEETLTFPVSAGLNMVSFVLPEDTGIAPGRRLVRVEDLSFRFTALPSPPAVSQR